jgi:DUF1680 family protein
MIDPEAVMKVQNMCRFSLVATIAISFVTNCVADDSKHARSTSLSIKQVAIDDEFWSPKLKTYRTVTIPDCFAKFDNDRGGAMNNFDRVRDGKTGYHAGPEWYDGLIYEMIRGSADFLAASPDAELEKQLDGYIDRIAAAAEKDPDGYINTWTQLISPKLRWGLNGGNDVQQHEVYNAGCLVEAGVHYYLATGKPKLLQVATKLANHMCDIMGSPPKLNVVPGHSVSEEAFVKLYVLYRDQPKLKEQMPFAVDEKRFLDLAEFWIENRGNHEGRRDFGAYAQDHLPVLQQATIEGHAVRATLLCVGMTAAALVDDRDDYVKTAERLWDNMVHRRMYVIGGLGAVAGHEGFGPDYILPNNGYLETCAAIGAAFFHQNMSLLTSDAKYVDEFERALYNAVLPGVSLKGDSYFYENPLEAGPQRKRWDWHDCPCCPPMFLKIMGALPGYIYSQRDDAVLVNLFVGSRAYVELKDGTKLKIRQTTRYPWDRTVRISVDPETESEFTVAVRLPGWCDAPALKLNDQPIADMEKVRGYAEIRRRWKSRDTIDLTLPMPIRRIKSHPKVEANVGRVALQRGPLIYCLEGVDNEGQVRNRVIPADAPLNAVPRNDLLGGIVTIEGQSLTARRGEWPDTLYQNENDAIRTEKSEFTAIPYFANANRRQGEMQVWIAEDPAFARPSPNPTLASRAIPTASHCWQNDTVTALNDQNEAKTSDDMSVPRFTWWNHRGTKEWVQYTFANPETVSAAEVYWWDESRIKAHCRVPQSWKLLYLDEGGDWKPVSGVTSYGVEMDKYNRVTFDKVKTKALKIEVELQPEWSSGILEWKLE